MRPGVRRSVSPPRPVRLRTQIRSLTKGVSKAYWRRAIANTAILNPKEALKDFKIVVRKAPTDRDAKLKLAECEKLVRRLDFEKAIEVAEPPSAFEGLDIESMVVEEAYDGVKLGNVMTQEFIDDMIKRFKSGKKIHKKYAFQIVKAVDDIVYNEPTMVEVGVEDGTKLTVCGDTHGMLDFIQHFGSVLTVVKQVNSSTSSKFSDSMVSPPTRTHTSSMVTLLTAAPGRLKSPSCCTPTNGCVLTSSSSIAAITRQMT